MAVLMPVVLAAGCTMGGSENDDMDDKLATLAQRPTIEEMSAAYEQMQTRLRDRLSAELGPLRWVNRENRGGAGCADFPGAGGQSLTLDRWTSEGNLPDAQWDRAVQIVAEVTGEYGFGPPESVVDRPGDHEITATDRYGGGYQFGTARNTVLMVSTGCHLPADRHPGPG
ncbi:MAG TPA: LppA family lipoprotein [Pseudonocardiaceae bacterium]|nr:LppA family lipoprotein [Pseudonocardiaceae bacterium]